MLESAPHAFARRRPNQVASRIRNDQLCCAFLGSAMIVGVSSSEVRPVAIHCAAADFDRPHTSLQRTPSRPARRSGSASCVVGRARHYVLRDGDMNDTPAIMSEKHQDNQ